MNDETKIKLLKVLEQDGRIDYKELAIEFGINENELLDEIEKMKKDGVIMGVNTLVNWDKLDNSQVTAIITTKISPQKDNGFDKIAEKIAMYPEVCDLYLISGTSDLLVQIKGHTFKDIAYFVNTRLAPIDGVIETSSNFILEKYKEKGINYSDKIRKQRMVVTP